MVFSTMLSGLCDLIAHTQRLFFCVWVNFLNANTCLLLVMMLPLKSGDNYHSMLSMGVVSSLLPLPYRGNLNERRLTAALSGLQPLVYV